MIILKDLIFKQLLIRNYTFTCFSWRRFSGEWLLPTDSKNVPSFRNAQSRIIKVTMESSADANHSDQESYYVLYHKKNEVFLHNWSNYRKTDEGHLHLMGIPFWSEAVGEQPFRICSAAISTLKRYSPTNTTTTTIMIAIKTIVRRSFLCNFYTKLTCTGVCLSK